jgi:hypothetical protein
MTLKGQQNKTVTIVTAYRPCKTTFEGAGDKTVYMQQYRSLLSHASTNNLLTSPDPHRQFILDLQAWIEMLQGGGSSIILNIDGNEDTSSCIGEFWPLQYKEGEFIQAPGHNGSLLTLVNTCGLVDSLSLLHTPPYPSTYAYGKNRIDLIYVSNDICSAAIRSGVIPLYGIFQGDHNACFLDLDSKILFRDDTQPIMSPSQRGLKLLDPRKVDAYIRKLACQVEYHNVMDKIETRH